MVNVKDIEQIIDNIINNISVKCGPTISEMHTMLGELSYDEQFFQLQVNDLLNPLEELDYGYKIERLGTLKDTLKELNEQYDPNEDDTFNLKARIMLTEEKISAIEDELFMYGRRLIEVLKKTNPVPQINKVSFCWLIGACFSRYNV